MVMGGRRKSSRHLWSALVITTFVACGAFLYITFSSGNKEEFSVPESKHFRSSPEMLSAEECVSVCDSEECVYQSKLLLDFMDTNVDPCENFFQFACGNIRERLGSEKFDTRGQGHVDMMAIKMKGIWENLNGNAINASRKMKVVYDSCMEYSSSDFKAVPTVLDFLSATGIQGWPKLTTDFKFDDPSLIETIAYFLSYREYGFVDFYASYNYSNYYPYHFTSWLETTKGPYEKKKKHERKYLVDRILKYFNLDTEAISGMWEESEAINDAITNLRAESMRLHNLDNAHKDDFILLECTQDNKTEYNDFCVCLGLFLNITGANLEINKEFLLIKKKLEYFMKNIFPVLRNFSDRSIANYLALNVFFNNLNSLNFYFRLLHDKVDPSIIESDIRNSKWTKCVEWIIVRMIRPSLYEYTRRELTKPLLQDVLNLVEEIIRVGVDLISSQEWMTQDERANVTNEILKIQYQNIIMAKYLTNEESINSLYEEFLPTHENFFQNVLLYKKWFKTVTMRGIIPDENPDTFEFFESPLIPNAYSDDHLIEIFVGMLMPPSYTPHLERFMNLVSIGTSAAHELGHNLEFFLGDHLNQSHYFEDHLKCLVNQYSQFRLETLGENLNGSQYLAENFADIVDVSIIDKIIEKYSSNDSSSLMPSLALSLKQQMYVSSAITYCTVYTKESDELYKDKNEVHSPDRYRIIGRMQNSKGFSEAFRCAKGSYMNPLTKCSLLG